MKKLLLITLLVVPFIVNAQREFEPGYYNYPLKKHTYFAGPENYSVSDSAGTTISVGLDLNTLTLKGGDFNCIWELKERFDPYLPNSHGVYHWCKVKGVPGVKIYMSFYMNELEVLIINVDGEQRYSFTKND